MPIIVNKEEKRRNIALASKALLLEHGIKNITISQIAKNAGVGKGTIYEYFSNKEDIVFEIISEFIADHEKYLSEVITQDISAKEKLFHFLFSLYQDEYHQKQLAIYREFLAISLTSELDEMVEFSTSCRTRIMTILETILHEAVGKNELKPEALELAEMFHTYAMGIVVETKIKDLEPRDLIERFLDGIFKVLEVKEKS